MELDKARELGNRLLTIHGLSSKWILVFDNAVRRFGQCRYSSCTISLSRNLVLLNSKERVEQTLLHEIAHALAGPEHGHDQVWRDIALRIGDDGSRCYSLKDTLQPEAKHVYACANCGIKIERIKRISRIEHKFHSSCGRLAGRIIKVK